MVKLYLLFLCTKFEIHTSFEPNNYKEGRKYKKYNLLVQKGADMFNKIFCELLKNFLLWLLQEAFKKILKELLIKLLDIIFK